MSSEESTVNTLLPAAHNQVQHPREQSYSRPEPSVVTVGVVLFEWNDGIRKRIQKLGALLGQAGIKLQLLTFTDIQQYEIKAERLDGMIIQIVGNADHHIQQRFTSILESHQPQILASHTVVAAFCAGNPQADEIEAAIDLSMKAHSRRCEWLGMVNAAPEDSSFEQWCTGIAKRVRQSLKSNSMLAA